MDTGNRTGQQDYLTRYIDHTIVSGNKISPITIHQNIAKVFIEILEVIYKILILKFGMPKPSGMVQRGP